MSLRQIAGPLTGSARRPPLPPSPPVARNLNPVRPSAARPASTVAVSLRPASGSKEARVLLGPTIGAQRASPRFSLTGRTFPRPRLRFLLVAALLATAIGGPAPAAATTTPPWYSVELYYLKLVNCTRTGGWVLSDGTCRGYGSGRYSAYVRPLYLTSRYSNRASRPYAKLLADRAQCSHFLDHDPIYRLRRAGYTGYTWGENIGCRDGYASAKAAVLASHLRFQAEKSTGGGHWKNIKNPRYTYIAIGVWRTGGRTRLVTDFVRL